MFISSLVNLTSNPIGTPELKGMQTSFCKQQVSVKTSKSDHKVDIYGI